MTASAATDVRPTTIGRLLPHALAFLAVGQLASSALSSLGSSDLMQPDRPGQPTITPEGYAFAIWGVIELLSLALAVWFVWFRRRAGAADAAVVDSVTRPLLVVFAGFSVWLVAAEVEPVWATLVVFLVMGGALFVALRAAIAGDARTRQWPPAGRFLLWATLGMYAGWSTVALWLNLTTALAYSGAPVSGLAGTVGQVAVLAGITATAVAVLIWTRGTLGYIAAVTWALVAAILGALSAGATLLAGVAVVGLAIALVVTVAQRLRRRVAKPELA